MNTADTVSDLYFISPTGEKISALSVLDTIIKKMSNKEVMDNSKGKYLITDFLEKLSERKDPFITSIATIGGEFAMNSVGILLFVAFQYGYTLASKNYQIDSETLKLRDFDITAE
jgi:hypothetical protein